MTPPLYAIDFDRVRDCLQGKVTHRGCGKTVAKNLVMISSALNDVDTVPTSSWLPYLFIAENERCVSDPTLWTMETLTDLNFDIIDFQPRMGAVKASYRGRYMNFRFSSPENIMTKVRGMTFKKIIMDLTYDTARQHARELYQLTQISLRP